ncbi:hypothetical protein KFK09_003761 [Dendrobium nobile]|uniref:Protein E6-like n=1 Tax=Dendrobium nobile TaxID=94219 RepID=A0A8T3C139_DENNO|nr:hypothetical protein KFK09_003761 [Dendrobium nobile]
MASFAHLLLSFLFILSFSMLPIRARELKSFNKAVHNEFPSETATNPEEIQASAAAIGGEQPENLPPQSTNGYGLYGHGSEEYFPTNERSKIPRTEFSTEIPESREANAFYPRDESQINKEKYGMSDTRVVENGKYFYDLNDQRHGEAYDPARGNSEGYGVKDNGRFGYGVYNYEGRGKGYGYSQEMEGKQNYQNQEINQEQYYEP